MFSFILTLLIIYILWLVVRPLWYGMRQYRSFMDQARRARNAYARAASGFGGADRKPKKKKIDRDTGEYVAFTEIEVTQSQNTATVSDSEGNTFTAEEQVTDIKWTDLP